MAQSTSFIRWAGGKSWLVPFVQELTQGLTYNNYFEPFMGGASVFFALKPPNHSTLSDMNEDLVNAFCAVRDEPNKVIKYLSKLKTDEKSYYEVRQSAPSGKYHRAARFLYLNAYSFNGLYRVNRQGKYNVPYGQRGKIKIDFDRLRECSKKLTCVNIICQDFDAIKSSIQAKDLIFFDPPYTVSRDTNMFIEYNSTLFSLDDQYRLGELIDYIRREGAYYIIANAAHPKIEEIFRKERDQMVPLYRSSHIGGKNAFRGRVEEYIFTNIPKRGKE